MDLMLLRHGHAEDFKPAGDAARALTERGVKHSRRAGRVLRLLDARPEVVLTSPRTRCVETAEAFCDAAEMPGPVIQAWINCGMSPATALSELSAFRDFGRVMLVGHEPDLSGLVEYLLGVGGGAAIDVKKGALVELDMPLSGRGTTLRCLVPPKLMRRANRAIPGDLSADGPRGGLA